MISHNQSQSVGALSTISAVSAGIMIGATALYALNSRQEKQSVKAMHNKDRKKKLALVKSIMSGHKNHSLPRKR